MLKKCTVVVGLLFLLTLSGCFKDSSKAWDNTPQTVIQTVATVGNNTVAAGGILKNEDAQLITQLVTTNDMDQLVTSALLRVVNIIGDNGDIYFEPDPLVEIDKVDHAWGTVHVIISLYNHTWNKDLVIGMDKQHGVLHDYWAITAIKMH